ncbi:hypothetical protein AVU38_gp160 [Ralstonia phage RSL2]|uniref:Uncharacterized protein n=1 Tax=Ralstonia phage RSL2 TaxID=1585840 RepID=A0A0A8J9G0_9CAUD|nr:hypothetical protein AVU38_gp160 [Ralstonia phage RSL2]BAQ02688.1 hypothetical protein [Ralstonia phage RSL2]
MKKILGKLGFINTDRQLKHEVLFGHEAAGKGEHGAIVGTWFKEGAKSPITISFFFKGHTHAPKMTPALIEELFFHAKTAGIDPTHLYSYSGLAPARASQRGSHIVRAA